MTQNWDDGSVETDRINLDHDHIPSFAALVKVCSTTTVISEYA